MLSNGKLFEFHFSSSRPYDFSLVELESGNYINANKIPFGTFSVIATQGMAISTESRAFADLNRQSELANLNSSQSEFQAI